MLEQVPGFVRPLIARLETEKKQREEAEERLTRGAERLYRSDDLIVGSDLETGRVRERKPGLRHSTRSEGEGTGVPGNTTKTQSKGE